MAIQHLQLVIPQALGHLRQLQEEKTVPRSLPLLQACLQQGERTRLWQQEDLFHARVEPWQQSLLYALPLELRQHGLAAAALSWRGEGGVRRRGTCLHVEPVHFQAGMDDVRCLMPSPLTGEQSAQLLQSLQPLLSLAGFELLHATEDAGGHWYLWCDRELQLTTFSLRSHSSAGLYDLMPQGADSGELRRLMTEVQMLLHDHPVNQQREARGLLPVNALWLWGNAPLGLVTRPCSTRVISNAPYVRGLCEHLEVDCWPLPPDAQSLPGVDAEQVLLVLPPDPITEIETRWLAPLHNALLRGEIRRLDLHLDHWMVSLQGGRWQQVRRWLNGRGHDVAELLS